MNLIVTLDDGTNIRFGDLEFNTTSTTAKGLVDGKMKTINVAEIAYITPEK